MRTRLLTEAASYKPLAILRIGAALILLWQGALTWSHRELLLDEFGLVAWSLGEQLIDPMMPRVSSVAAFFARFGLTSQQTVTVVMATHLFAAVGLLFGLKTRVCAFIAWITHLVLIGTGVAFTYGLGKLLVIALFYCLVMPVGREWSLDHRLRRSAGPAAGEDASLSVLVLRLHLCIIYAAAGISKSMGEQWWSGDAVWRALALPQFQQFDPSALLHFPWIIQAVSVTSVVVQLLYPVLAWTRLRFAIVVATELMHLGIAVFLGLWLFSGIMIVLNAAAFGESLWRTVSGRLARAGSHGERRVKVTIVYDGGCPFCSDYVAYQDLKARAEAVELVDARSDAQALARYAIDAADLEDGMVVIVDGVAHRGAAAVHTLSTLSRAPRNWWVAAVAFVSRSAIVSSLLYPFLKLGRRIALTVLGVARFSERERPSPPR